MQDSTTIGADARENYDRDGYLILDDVGVSEEVLDGIISDLSDKYVAETRIDNGVYYAPGRIQDAWRISDNVKAVARSPKILGLLEEFYGRKPLPFQTLNFEQGTQQPTHSDALHFNSMPPGFMCGVWVALEDIDMDNGPLVYYPGSHKLPEVTMQEIGAEPDQSEYPKYEQHVRELLEREGLEPAYSTISKGQALIWSSNLLHGGAPQNDMSRTRRSQVTHYFFEGCKYYTPMLSDTSDEENVFWRDPAWVV
jgi:ectoine hydroxylase-related dioxygenase (phytanoyl-CoA dioxygenase family)